MTCLDTEESRLIRERLKQLADDYDLTEKEIAWVAYDALVELSKPSERQESPLENVDPHF